MNLSPRGDRQAPGVNRILFGVVAGLSLACQFAPGVAGACEWRRRSSAITWMTSHICHWSWNHFLWDIGAFAVLSVLVLRLRPSRYGLCLALAAFAIPLEILWNQPLINCYRGLSGLVSALMGLAVASLWQCAATGHSNRPHRPLATLGAIGFVAKVLWESCTGTTLFVRAGMTEVVPVFSAHMVGFATGLVTGLWPQRRILRHSPPGISVMEGRGVGWRSFEAVDPTT